MEEIQDLLLPPSTSTSFMVEGIQATFPKYCEFVKLFGIEYGSYNLSIGEII